MSREEGSSLARNVDLCVDACDTDTSVRVQDALILQEIAEERIRQDDKWGEQNHPDGTDTKWVDVALGMKAKCESKARDGKLTFRDILEEEIWEAYGETDPDLLRAELVQAAAVIVNWLGAIDRRASKET